MGLPRRDAVSICLPGSPRRACTGRAADRTLRPRQARGHLPHGTDAQLGGRQGERRRCTVPTYATDGFTHATADPKYLLTVGNHFYKETKAPDGSGKPSEWKLLKMTRRTLEAKRSTSSSRRPHPSVTPRRWTRSRAVAAVPAHLRASPPAWSCRSSTSRGRRTGRSRAWWDWCEI